MKIAMVLPDDRDEFKQWDWPEPFFGAAPTALFQGLRKLPELEVHVVCSVHRPMFSPVRLGAENIFYHPVLVPRMGWWALYTGCVLSIRRKLREIGPDLVHGQGTERHCALSAMLSGYPNVVTIHGNMAELARSLRVRIGSHGWLSGRMEDFTLPRTRGVLCNSAYTEALVRLRARQVWRVPNPVRLPFFETPLCNGPRPRAVLLNVGFVCEYKRQLELLAVAEKLHRDGVKMEFQFVGRANPDDAYARRFLDRIKSAEQAGYARYLGVKTAAELVGCMDQASALVNYSFVESFGLVVAEALARNLKFFGARGGGMVDICAGVPDAELLAPDDWDGLADAISRWVKSGFPRPVVAAAQMRKRYHPDVIAARHVEIYREVIGD